MKVARAAHSLIHTPNGILVVGGITKNCVVTPKCEIYDVDTDTWSLVGSLKEPTMNSSLCILNDNYIIKLGGKIDENTLGNKIEIFSMKNYSW